MRWYAITLAAVLLTACTSSGTVTAPAVSAPAAPATDPAALNLLFAYGSEKEPWVAAATTAYNAAGHRCSDGRLIQVQHQAMGSGECLEEVLSGRLEAHLLSPASGAFVTLGNARSRAATGQDLLPRTDNLVLSPVVIALWQPMAEALGWPARRLGWSDILALAQDDRGWAAHGQPAWGTFRFGHTHPEHSNSGLIAILAEIYAACGKTAGLTLADLAKPEVGAQLAAIEASVVHYGSSTGFFGRTMLANGPGYLSAAVLYENMVIESRQRQPPPAAPLVAIYPKEGTFWSDHPAGIVERPWVTAEHRTAARDYLDFLLAEAQQREALRFGFRPGSPSVPPASPIDATHGVDPAEPQTSLEVPSAEVLDAAIRLWHQHKKPAHVALVIDTSGSMNEEGRMPQARLGAQQLVAQLHSRDRFSLLPFSDRPQWSLQNAALATVDEQRAVAQRIAGLMPMGGTALYDATAEAAAWLAQHGDPRAINAVVVLTDGADSGKGMALEQLLTRIRASDEGRAVRVFTIGYGAGANADVLKRIAETTRAKSFTGTPETIVQVLREISTFF